MILLEWRYIKTKYYYYYYYLCSNSKMLRDKK